MNTMKRSIKRLFWFLFIIFVICVLWILKLNFIDRESIVTNAYNSRLNIIPTDTVRGEIKDINGVVLAHSEKNEDGSYTRVYDYGKTAAHVTGYSSPGKSGLEAKSNFDLTDIHNEILQRIKQILTKEDMKANTVYSSIDIEVQQKAYELLGKKEGAIVVMDPSTGRIIASVSYPTFDPNTVSENWDDIKEDENSPLFDRALQGGYPPGSTFKIITALAALENMPDINTFTYECTGEAEFKDKVIHCYDNTAHGTVDLHSAFAASCNCYFSKVATIIGPEKLIETALKFGFNEDFSKGYEASNPSLSLTSESTESELVETSIGQGKTLASPLYMAMVASAIANDGVMMTPYLVDHVEYSNGKVKDQTVPKMFKEISSYNNIKTIQEMMLEVCETGTGKAAQINNYSVAGKTGTAENPEGSDHSWFVGYAPYDDPKYVVSVFLKNPSGGAKATPIAGKLFDYLLNK